MAPSQSFRRAIRAVTRDQGSGSLWGTYLAPWNNPPGADGWDSALKWGKWGGEGIAAVGAIGTIVVEAAGVGGVVLWGGEAGIEGAEVGAEEIIGGVEESAVGEIPGTGTIHAGGGIPTCSLGPSGASQEQCLSHHLPAAGLLKFQWRVDRVRLIQTLSIQQDRRIWS